MAYYTEGFPLDPNFVPTPTHVNFIKGLIYGALSDEGSADGGGEYQLNHGWVFENLPNTRRNIDDLIGAGFVDHSEGGAADDGVYHSYGLTDPAVDWAIKNLGLPAPRFDGTQGQAEKVWLANVVFVRKGERSATNVDPGLWMARSTSRYVSRTNFTPEQAMQAHGSILRDVASGEINKRSAAAYKAHVTRRTTT